MKLPRRPGHFRSLRDFGSVSAKLARLGLLLVLVVGCARSTATAPAPASEAAASAPVPTAARLDEGTYQLDAVPGQLLLSGRAVLFTAAGSRRIYRLDLESSQVSEVAASRYYPDGILSSYRLQLAGDWLIYLEISARDNGRSWTLAGLNLATGETEALDQATDDEAGWPGPEVAADGDWVVWTRKEAAGGGVRSIIRALNLQSRQGKILAEELDASREAWGWPNLQGGRLVVERDRLAPGGATSQVQLVDVQSGEVTILSEGPASEPALGGQVVAWKAGPRYGRGPLVLYDLASGQSRTLDGNVEYPRSGDGLVVAWAEGQGLVRVDAATGRRAPLPQAPAGYQAGPEASVDGSRVAWVETAAGQARLRLAG